MVVFDLTGCFDDTWELVGIFDKFFIENLLVTFSIGSFHIFGIQN